jgi:hypothetical protein
MTSNSLLHQAEKPRLKVKHLIKIKVERRAP